MLTIREPILRLLFFNPYKPLTLSYLLLLGSIWRATLKIMMSADGSIDKCSGACMKGG